MPSLMDFRLQIEQILLSLTRTEQARLEQLAYSRQAASKPKKKEAVRSKSQAVSASRGEATTA